MRYKEIDIPVEQLAVHSSDGMLMLTAAMGVAIGIILVVLGRKGKQIWMWVWGYGLILCSAYLDLTMRYGINFFTYF